MNEIIETKKEKIKTLFSEKEISTRVSALIFQNNYTSKDINKILNEFKKEYYGQYEDKLLHSTIKDLFKRV